MNVWNEIMEQGKCADDQVCSIYMGVGLYGNDSVKLFRVRVVMKYRSTRPAEDSGSTSKRTVVVPPEEVMKYHT